MLKIAWAPVYAHQLPEHHRFPMEKYNLLPQQLIYEGTIGREHLFAPDPLDESIILKTHSPSYWDKLKQQTLSKQEIRKTGFPLSSALVEREKIIANGTLQASLFALQYGIAMNIAGGTHHAFEDRGEGFCLLNDIAISANFLLSHTAIERVLVVDLDVHQGNGTAQLFANNPSVFTFSMHGSSNYPLQKEKSDLDIALPDFTPDALYLSTLIENINRLFLEFKPQFIFYQAGVDILETDKLGRLAVSMAGCKERDRIVLEKCKEENIPLTVTMGGGYSEKLSQIIEAHANTFRVAQHIFF